MEDMLYFGDMVEDATGERFVVSFVDERTGVIDVANDSGYLYQFKRHNLTLIPHPDSIRLEKLGRRDAARNGGKFDLDAYRREIDRIPAEAPE